MLYRPQTETLEVFPSPDALKRMIIISTKLPKENNSRKGKQTFDEETLAKQFTEQKPEFEYDDKVHIYFFFYVMICLVFLR